MNIEQDSARHEPVSHAPWISLSIFLTLTGTVSLILAFMWVLDHALARQFTFFSASTLSSPFAFWLALTAISYGLTRFCVGKHKAGLSGF